MTTSPHGSAAPTANAEARSGQGAWRRPHGNVGALEADPWHLVAARRGTEPVFLWWDPATGVAFAALGAVASFVAPETSRFEAARQWCSTVVERVQRPAEHLGLPLVVGAFAFDAAARTCDASWSEWPRSWLWVPEIVAYDAGGGLLVRGHGADGERRAARLGRHLPPFPERPASPAPPLPPATERDRGRYRDVVRSALNFIDDGGARKLVVARAQAVESPGDRDFDALATARALRRSQAHATTFALARGDRWFVGATPELLVERRAGRIDSLALAATRPQDPRHEPWLPSAKEQHEHELVVAGIARDLAPLCDDLTIGAQPVARPAGGIVHLATPIHGRSSLDLVSLVAALHPTPALAGAPRDAACRWLARHEGFDRGLYAGPVGWLGGDGDGLFVAAIRSALITARSARLFAGAGIVRGSVPDDEWRETQAKLATLGGAIATRPRDRAASAEVTLP
jgi:isochorismate synthase